MSLFKHFIYCIWNSYICKNSTTFTSLCGNCELCLQPYSFNYSLQLASSSLSLFLLYNLNIYKIVTDNVYRVNYIEYCYKQYNFCILGELDNKKRNKPYKCKKSYRKFVNRNPSSKASLKILLKSWTTCSAGVQINLHQIFDKK